MPKDDEQVGCGIGAFFLKNSRFHAACEWHDVAYLRGSFMQTGMSRKEADRWFLVQMLGMSKSWIDRLHARAFYALARLFGERFWEGPRR